MLNLSYDYGLFVTNADGTDPTPLAVVGSGGVADQLSERSAAPAALVDAVLAALASGKRRRREGTPP